MTQPNQNFRKAKRRLNRKHNRALAFQQPVNGAKPPADRVRHMNSRDIMADTKPQMLGAISLTLKTARRMCGYVRGGPSRWWPHQNTRECERRQRQLAAEARLSRFY